MASYQVQGCSPRHQQGLNITTWEVSSQQSSLLISPEKNSGWNGETTSSASRLKTPRRRKDLVPLLLFAADLVVAALPLYFAVFAIITLMHDQTAFGGTGLVELLVEGAVLGPTVFTILFAAIVGRCLTSVAAWSLERGATFLSLEQLLGSRTVSSAMLIGPLRLRIIDWTTIGLFVLWALSPLGSQAAQRVVFVGPSSAKTNATYAYLDVSNSGMPSWLRGLTLETVNTGFRAALLSPPQDKNRSQDLFGNVKIPLLEHLDGYGGNSSWVEIPENSTVVYAALAGIPVTPTNGSAAYVNAKYMLETSYLLATCNNTQAERLDDPRSLRPDNKTIVGGDNLIMDVDSQHSINSTIARRIVLGSLVQSEQDDYYYISRQFCDLTTSYVEVEISCRRTACNINRVRRSQREHQPAHITSLDDRVTQPIPTASQFLGFFLNSTGTQGAQFNAPIIQYFFDQDYPFSLGGLGQSRLWLPLSDLPQEEFSLRMTQLLSTWYLWNVAPLGLSGGFANITRQGRSDAEETERALATTIAEIVDANDVINCSRSWFAVLMLASLVMFLAGLLTAVLNLTRRGPDIIDSFTGLTTASRLDAPMLSTLNDSPDRVRQLRYEKARLGDLQCKEAYGYVGITLERNSGGPGLVNQSRLFE